MLNIRPLRADEIECRVAQCGTWGAQLLLYKNARVDMEILDETVGPENWTREHYECKGNLFCRVSINVNFNNPEKEEKWISKSDCGSESNTEKEKGEASDSFKRSCVNWNIGRELYSSPTIFAKCEVESNGKGGYVPAKKNKFTVANIEIDKPKNKIVYLKIVDKFGAVVYEYKDADFYITLKKTPPVEAVKAPVASEEVKVEHPVTEATKPATESEKAPQKPLREVLKEAAEEKSAQTPVTTPTGEKRRVRREVI